MRRVELKRETKSNFDLFLVSMCFLKLKTNSFKIDNKKVTTTTISTSEAHRFKSKWSTNWNSLLLQSKKKQNVCEQLSDCRLQNSNLNELVYDLFIFAYLFIWPPFLFIWFNKLSIKREFIIHSTHFQLVIFYVLLSRAKLSHHSVLFFRFICFNVQSHFLFTSFPLSFFSSHKSSYYSILSVIYL
jgi:hypothetical protein